MESEPDNGRYGFAARLIHWVMAAGFAFMRACGYAMTTLVVEDSPLEELLFGLHISTGVTLLALLAAPHRRQASEASAAASAAPDVPAAAGDATIRVSGAYLDAAAAYG